MEIGDQPWGLSVKYSMEIQQGTFVDANGSEDIYKFAEERERFGLKILY